MKIFKANPNSKTQKQKAEKSKQLVVNRIGCINCGITNVTLRKYDNNYYCEHCFSKIIVDDMVKEITK